MSGIQTSEQQAATARRLKPHSRSAINLEKLNRPEGLTPIQPAGKRHRPTKWQFGIRSRNQPAEAMLAIYKALRAMGAEWEVPKARKAGGTSSGDVSPRDGSPDADGSEDDDSTNPGSRRHSDAQHGFDSDSDQDDRSTSSSGRGRGRDRDARSSRYTPHNDWGYSVPQDPWIINARFRKGGMFAPGVVHASSAHSSRVDLSEESSQRRAAGSAASVASGTPSMASDLGANAASVRSESVNSTYSGVSRSGSRRDLGDSSPVSGTLDDSAYVYMTIQLYSIEKEFYLVDFKCAGYERLVRHLVQGIAEAEDVPDGDDDDIGPTGEIGEGHHGKLSDTSRNHLSSIDDHVATKDFSQKGGSLTRASTPSRKMHEELVGHGRAVEEKDVSSPFPFLDVASRLIIQLAEAE